MEYIVIIIVSLVIAIILAIVFGININETKQIAKNDELDKLAQKYPSNRQICEDILDNLNIKNVKIEENDEAKNSLYIAISNKILIANMQNNFSRIQTIAHECIHASQKKSIQLFNFVYSNIYLLYFVVIIILAILKKLPNEMLFLSIFILLGLVYYMVRSYLENDAMIKARFIAKEYMQKQALCTQDECNKIIDGFDKINNIGIKGVNYSLCFGVLIKIAILSAIFLIF